MLGCFLITVRAPNSYPIYSFLTSNGKFDDFYNLVTLDPERPFLTVSGYVHMPLSLLLYGLLTPTKYFGYQDGLVVFQLISISVLLVGATKLAGSVRVGITLMLTYPVVCGFFRANNEMLLVAAFMFGCHYLEKHPRKSWGPMCMAFGQLLEPSPFLLLCFPIKRVVLSRTFIFTGVIGVSAFLLLLEVHYQLGPIKVLTAISTYLSADVGTAEPMSLHNHSFRAGIDSWLKVLDVSNLDLSTPIWRIAFLVVLPLLATLPLMTPKLWRKSPDIIDRTILTAILTVAMPTHSFSYRMMWFMVPLCLILRDTMPSTLRGHRAVQVILMFLLMQPKTFFWITSDTDPGFYEASLLDPLLLLFLYFVTIRFTSKVSLVKDTVT